MAGTSSGRKSLTKDYRSTDPDSRPPLRIAIPLGIQHVLAMFAGNVTIPIILAGLISASPAETTQLIQIAIFVAGLATLVQSIGIGPIGARLPIVQGTGFVFAAVAFPLATQYGLPAVFGGAIVAAAVQILVGFALRYIMFLFPTVVLGIVLTSVGLGLMPTGIEMAAGGAGSSDFGSAQNLGLAVFVLIVALLLSHYGKGMVSAAAVLLALVVGYLVAIPMGLVNFAPVVDATWFSAPLPLQFGIAWEPAAMIAMGIAGIVNALDSMGSLVAVTKGGADREPTEREFTGLVTGSGIGAALAGVFGTVPNTAFSQNAGLVPLTGIMSRHVVSLAGGMLVVFSIFPKASAVLTAMPSAVLGGAALILFGTVLAIGIKILGETGMDQRLLLIVAASLTVGQGLALVPETLAGLPSEVSSLLGTGVVPTVFIAIILNLVLRENKTLEPVAGSVATSEADSDDRESGSGG